jgi:hypothetical protein
MPDLEADRQADTYWETLVSRVRQREQNAQSYAIGQRQPEARERADQSIELPLVARI